MLLRLLIDQDLDHDILRGLVRRVPDLDAVTAHEARLTEAPDPELLEWAAESERIVVTHDRKTMPGHAANRVAAGERMPGVFIVPRRLSISQVIDDLELMMTCSDEGQWENITRYLPL